MEEPPLVSAIRRACRWLSIGVSNNPLLQVHTARANLCGCGVQYFNNANQRPVHRMGGEQKRRNTWDLFRRAINRDSNCHA